MESVIVTDDNPLGIAWCPTCQCNTLPHDRHGTCLFCDTLIADATKPLFKPTPVKRGRYKRRTRESITADLHTLAARFGRPPKVQDDLALAQSAKKHYGSWAHAVEAAGFPKPSRATRYREAA